MIADIIIWQAAIGEQSSPRLDSTTLNTILLCCFARFDAFEKGFVRLALAIRLRTSSEAHLIANC